MAIGAIDTKDYLANTKPANSNKKNKINNADQPCAFLAEGYGVNLTKTQRDVSVFC